MLKITVQSDNGDTLVLEDVMCYSLCGFKMESQNTAGQFTAGVLNHHPDNPDQPNDEEQIQMIGLLTTCQERVRRWSPGAQQQGRRPAIHIPNGTIPNLRIK